jgi:hypothetical protein
VADYKPAGTIEDNSANTVCSEDFFALPWRPRNPENHGPDLLHQAVPKRLPSENGQRGPEPGTEATLSVFTDADHVRRGNTWEA